MFRLLALFAAITVLELVAARALGQPPAGRPPYYDLLMGSIALLMCVGGVESARWLLRRSPAARAPGPASDWTRLWLWTGVPGGFLLALGILLSWALSGFLAPKTGLLLLAHFVTGALLWIGCAFWTVPDLLRSGALSQGLTRRLTVLGLSLHGLGVALYLWVYPALLRGPWKVDLGLLVSMISHYYFIFYYVLVSGLAWAFAFQVWQPPQAEAKEKA